MPPDSRPPVRALLVEDDPDAAAIAIRRLQWSERARFDVVHEPTLGEALARLEDRDFDVMILDLGLPDAEMLTTMGNASLLSRSLPIVILSANSDEELATRAVRLGVEDYLVKQEQDGRSLVRAVLHAIERARRR